MGLQELGWHQNLTFTHDEIGLGQYLRSLIQMTPPVSELYLGGNPADSAVQMLGTLKTREHIRWWNKGAGVHFGAISRDDEIAVKYYGHLPVFLHDIDPKVDASRQLLAEQVRGADRYTILGIAPLARRVSGGENSDFETDGGVLVITENAVQFPESGHWCLRLQSVSERDARCPFIFLEPLRFSIGGKSCILKGRANQRQRGPIE